jgi:hypothetical protein
MDMSAIIGAVVIILTLKLVGFSFFRPPACERCTLEDTNTLGAFSDDNIKKNDDYYTADDANDADDESSNEEKEPIDIGAMMAELQNE